MMWDVVLCVTGVEEGCPKGMTMVMMTVMVVMLGMMVIVVIVMDGGDGDGDVIRPIPGQIILVSKQAM